MAVTSHVYPKFIDQLNKKAVSLTADTYKAGLCTGDASAWTATQQVFQFVSDITTAYTEVTTGGGYTSGFANRQALTTFTLTTGTAPGTDKWTCTSPAPISFGATATISARSMFIFSTTANGATTDANAWVACIIDFGVTVVSTAGPFTYTVDPTNGLALFTAS
jgi:hypothetical protein